MTRRFFGLNLESRFPLLAAPEGRGRADLLFEWAAHPWEKGLPPPAWEGRRRLPDGRPATLLFRLGRADLLRFTGVADFLLPANGARPARVTGYPAPGAANAPPAEVVEVYLLGTVLSFWLERAGIPALHASAVVVEGRAVAFLSTNGGGKSCLAAAFLQAGYPLLTDDVLPVEEAAAGRFVGRPGYPSMRLWPDEAAHFLGAYEHLPLVVPGLSKRRVPIGRGFGAFHDAAVPIRCFYVPERRAPGDPDPAIRVSPLSRAEGLLQLLGHSFIPSLIEPLGIQGERMQRLGRLVRGVPVRRLSYPSGLEKLSRVRDAVLAGLAAGPLP